MCSRGWVSPLLTQPSCRPLTVSSRLPRATVLVSGGCPSAPHGPAASCLSAGFPGMACSCILLILSLPVPNVPPLKLSIPRQKPHPLVNKFTYACLSSPRSPFSMSLLWARTCCACPWTSPMPTTSLTRHLFPAALPSRCGSAGGTAHPRSSCAWACSPTLTPPRRWLRFQVPACPAVWTAGCSEQSKAYTRLPFRDSFHLLPFFETF